MLWYFKDKIEVIKYYYVYFKLCVIFFFNGSFIMFKFMFRNFNFKNKIMNMKIYVYGIYIVKGLCKNV